MRIFVFDPGLTGRYGHHDHMAEGLWRDLKAAGFEVALFGNRKADPGLLAALPVTPLFRQSHYQVTSADPYDGMVLDLGAGSRMFAEDIASLGAGAPGGDDLVIVPTTGLREAVGLGMWMMSSNRRPRAAILFHRAHSPTLDLLPGSLAAAMHRQASRAIAPVAQGGRWLVGATTARLARMIEAPLGMPVEHLPVPIWYGAAAGPAGRRADGAPVVAFLGDMRPEKGYHVVPPLIRAIRAKGATAGFLVHLGVARNITDLSAYHALQQEGLAQVYLGWVPDDQMRVMLERASLVALPYARLQYGNTLSGIFALSVASARPCVVPSGTWMADQVAEGAAAGLSYPDDAIDGMADTACRALAQLEDLRERAESLAPRWRAEQSGSALVARLIAWAS